jgi:hypothetical protein
MDPTLVDKIIAGDSAAEITDYIKDTLFAKASSKVNDLKPEVASQLFGGETEDEVGEVVDEIEVEEPNQEIPEEE